MAVRLPKSSALAAINLTPLIDCVFLLLIFFLVASRIADEEPQLDLDLPNVSEALPAMFQPQELIVNINAEGRFFINGQFHELEQVEQIMRTRDHQPRIAQRACALLGTGILMLDHFGDPPGRIGDDPAV